MKYSIIALLSLVICTSCNSQATSENEQLSRVADEAIQKNAVVLTETQEVIMHKAYIYKGKFQKIPVKGQIMVAVDVQLVGFADSKPDPEDLEILDGRTNQILDSRPAIACLLDDGSIGEFIDDYPANQDMNSYRMLLVFYIPDTVTSVKLGYWGEILTEPAISIQPSGLVVPEELADQFG